MPKPKVEHNIDLQCSLCPKNPTFSDVSHLLTHISSKGHLANRFKLQIRAKNEAEAKETLETFDFWYRTSNLDALLSERLTAKDQKKAKKSRTSNGSTSSATSIKQEKKSERAPITAPEAPTFRAPVPPMQLWSTSAAATSTPSKGADNWEPSMYSTPTARRQIPNFTRPETPGGDKVDPNLTTPWKPVPEDGDDEGNKKSGDQLTDSAKLKGVTWPGMDLFDSATPEMKRTRNQKKDGNVLESMMATSRNVEPAEMSYHPNGDFRGSRDIFGPLSTENSPVKSASPKKRRAARKMAPALNNLSTNAPRLRASRGQKPAPGYSPQKPVTMSMAQGGHSMYLQPPPTLNPLATGLNNQRFHPSAEEDEEFRMTVGGLGLQKDERKKRTFTIFQEAPQISPGRTETPLEDHGFDFPHHGVPSYSGPSMNTSGFQPSPTPASKPALFGFGKENGTMDMQHHHHHARRTLSDSHVYPSQVFYEPSYNAPYNPLYNHAYTRSYGYTAQFTFNENKSPGGFNHNLFGAPSDYKLQSSYMTTRAPQSQGPTMGSGNTAAQGSGFGM